MKVQNPTALSIMLCIVVDSALILFSSIFWGGHDDFQKALYIVILFWWLPFWMFDKSYQNNSNPHSIPKENLL